MTHLVVTVDEGDAGDTGRHLPPAQTSIVLSDIERLLTVQNATSQSANREHFY